MHGSVVAQADRHVDGVIFHVATLEDVDWFCKFQRGDKCVQWKFLFDYRVTRRVFSKSVTSKLHILFQKILAGSLKTLKVTRISAMYTNFSHPPVHSGPSKFSRPKI